MLLFPLESWFWEIQSSSFPIWSSFLRRGIRPTSPIIHDFEKNTFLFFSWVMVLRRTHSFFSHQSRFWEEHIPSSPISHSFENTFLLLPSVTVLRTRSFFSHQSQFWGHIPFTPINHDFEKNTFLLLMGHGYSEEHIPFSHVRRKHLVKVMWCYNF